MWCIKKIKFLDEENFDVDYKWFFFMYEMVLGWSMCTYEKLAYPYYMKNNKTFTLMNSGKAFFLIPQEVLVKLSLI
jgi:hypothetical protein